MAVKTYSLKKDGDKALSAHFKVREFASKDGSDTVKISEELVAKLEKLRSKLNCSAISIHSGYRSAAHNTAVGGSKTSKHVKGMAADVFCYRDGKVIPSREVCCALQDMGLPGIAYVTSAATHLDVRTGGRFWADESKNDKRVPNFYRYFSRNVPVPTRTVRRNNRGQNVRRLQAILEKNGLYTDVIDGHFGGNTFRALLAFQKKAGLEQDGVCGPLTRKALKGYA